MTHYLLPCLLRLFEPREPLLPIAPLDHDPIHRRGPIIDPLSNHFNLLKENQSPSGTSVFVAPQMRKRHKVCVK
jgi:hypothetical protein